MKASQTVARLIQLCCAFCLIFGLTTGVGYAEDNPNANKSVAEEYQQPGAGSTQSGNPGAETVPTVNVPSGWTFLFQVIFSLGFIVLLIYFLLRFLASKQNSLAGRGGGMRVVSAVGVGSGKTVQVVMIGDSLYVLGVGENVTLIRHIPAGDEMDTILADMEIKAASGTWDSLITRWRARKQDESYSFSEEANQPGSFDDMLGQKWEEMAGQTQLNEWDEENRHGKGDRI